MPKFQTAASAAACAFLLGAAITPANAQSNGEFVFDLPAESLAKSLRDVANRTGRSVIAPDALIASRQTPPLAGAFTAEQAIARLLQGTGLQSRAVDGTLVVEAANPGGKPRPAPDSSAASAITVTGTRIRGVGSTSPVMVATRRELEQAGVNDLADFTRILPQNYTGGQNRGIAGAGEQGGQTNLNNSAALNLRGLGPDATLTLLNGHRLSYDAVDQGVDISAIPLSAMERIEIVADGASALYGSDAVAGVANIILRRDYEGLESTIRAGAATDGGDVQQEVSLVGGHRWGSGGFMLALDESGASPIYAGQRDYTRSVDQSLTLIGRNRQYSGVLSAHQQVAGGLALEINGYLMSRRSLLQSPYSQSADVHVIGLVSRPQVTSYALAPTLRAELGAGWQATASATASNSRTILDIANYYDSVPQPGQALYADTLRGAEITAEGPLLALPGGDARLAIGGGFRTISLHDRYQLLADGQWQTTRDFTQRRNVQFAYGELALPLVAPDLHVPLVSRLALSAALRSEHWNNIASVTTPKLGLIYAPVADLTVRATWGKSFKIPTLYQANQIEEGDLIPGFYFTPPPQPDGSPVLILSGSTPNLKPERATSWSTTLEWAPRRVRGLKLNATYFHIDYRDRIAEPLASVGLTALYNPLYSNFVVHNPTAAQVQALIAALPGGLVNQTGEPFDPAGVGAIVDGSTRNTERQRIHGVDFGGDYRLDLGHAGRLLVTGAGSYLVNKQQLAANLPLLPIAGTVFNPPHWRGRAGAAWDGREAGLSAFVNYLGPTIDNAFPELKRVGAFVTLDLNASFRPLAGSGPLRNVELRLSALNLLNQKPHRTRSPYPEAPPYDSTNESPVGRFVGASLRKIW